MRGSNEDRSTCTNTDKTHTMKATNGITPVPAGYGTLYPFILLNDVDGCLSFRQRAFDAQVSRMSLKQNYWSALCAAARDPE